MISELPIFKEKKRFLWQDLKSDAIATIGSSSLPKIIKLLFLHSGFQLLFAYRLQQTVSQYGFIGNIIGRLILKFGTDLTSCHINYQAYLEGGIHFPHATGIVIGEGSIISSGVTIYQNVTIGRRKNLDYPELLSNCTIYPGAQILGNIVIGKNAQVGANAVVINSVPDNALVVAMTAQVVKPKEGGIRNKE